MHSCFKMEYQSTFMGAHCCKESEIILTKQLVYLLQKYCCAYILYVVCQLQSQIQ